MLLPFYLTLFHNINDKAIAQVVFFIAYSTSGTNPVCSWQSHSDMLNESSELALLVIEPEERVSWVQIQALFPAEELNHSQV